MTNLLNAYSTEQKENLKQFIQGIKAIETREKLNTWHYKNMLPKGKNVSTWDKDKLTAYLIERKSKQVAKNIESKIKQIKEISESGEFQGAVISIEWKRSQMWGSNPRAEAPYSYTNEGKTLYNDVYSGSIGGCGYDKESTAIANCLNQIPQLMKALYEKKNKEYKPTNKESDLNRQIFGYGSGYGVFPCFEGGVGTSCYPDIFKSIGFKFSRTASGKTFDVYTIEKL